MGIVALVTFNAFEALAVSTAMPVAATELGGVREYALAFSLFMTTSLLGTVLAGGWADATGPRLPLVTGLALFGVGLVVSGVATSFSLLIVGRGVAGFGAGLQIVSLYVIVADSYPTERHARIFSYLSAAWVVPSIIGPALAGWVASSVSWRIVFLGVPPLAVLAWLVLLTGLTSVGTGRAGREPAAGPEQRRAESQRARAAYGLCLAGGALLVQWGTQDVKDWFGIPVTVAGVAVVVLSLPPLLPRGALRLHLGLPSVVITRGLLTASFFATETFIPLLLVTSRGFSPAKAGLVLTGASLGWSAGSWLLGRDWLHWARRRSLVTGALVMSVGMVCLVGVGLAWFTEYAVLGIWLVAGLGMGMAYSSTSVLALLLAPQGEEGRASSALQLCDGLGGVLGIGISGAIFAVAHQPGRDDGHTLAGIWAGLAVVAALAMVTGSRARLRA
ncbi:MAG: MFS transporter [Actinomycetales bacterium]